MDIQIDDIPYSLHQMVEIIGMEEFLENFARCMEDILSIFPFIIRLLWGIGIGNIVKEYNGKNLTALRNKYGLSPEQIKYILKKEGVR